MKSQKDVLALGQAIVRQLELQDRGAILERWLAHHLAEVIAEAERSVGSAKAASEAQAVDLVLKLWIHRRALPEPVDPLGGYRRAVEVLGRLAPEADPWAHFRQSDTHDGLLREMFQLLSRIVLAGLLLTQTSRSRPITAEESAMLEEEEKYLVSAFEQWMPFLRSPRSKPEIKVAFPDTNETGSTEPDDKAKRLGDSLDQDHTPDDPAATDDVQLHAAIASNLEQMHADLATLLTRWRESQPCIREGTGENAMVHDDRREAIMTDTTSNAGSGEGASKRPDGEPANADSAQPSRDHAFWSSLSLTALAEAQGVAPVEDLGSIVALWPVDDDPDEFLAHVLAERADRRRAAQGEPPQ